MTDTQIMKDYDISHDLLIAIAGKRSDVIASKKYYVEERKLNEFRWEKPVENRYWEKLDWFEVYNPVNPFLQWKNA